MAGHWRTWSQAGRPRHARLAFRRKARVRRPKRGFPRRAGPRVLGRGPLLCIVTLALIGIAKHLDELRFPSVFAGSPSAISGLPAMGPRFSGRVTRVVDGDTLWIGGQAASIRVWGLDAPEMHMAGGRAARDRLTSLVSGQTLSCRHRGTDRYRRIVGQCFLADGRDITAVMIRSDSAREYCRYSGNHYRTC